MTFINDKFEKFNSEIGKVQKVAEEMKSDRDDIYREIYELKRD